MTDQNNTPQEPATFTSAPATGASASTPTDLASGASSTPDDAGTRNVAIAVLAGIGLGLVGALVYALVARFLDREIGFLALLIGFGVAFGIVQVGRRTSVLLGVIAAVIAAACFFVAIFAAAALIISNEFGVTVMEAMDVLLAEPGSLISGYFAEDPMSYLFVGLAVAPAFVIASGLRKS